MCAASVSWFGLTLDQKGRHPSCAEQGKAHTRPVAHPLLTPRRLSRPTSSRSMHWPSRSLPTRPPPHRSMSEQRRLLRLLPAAGTAPCKQRRHWARKRQGLGSRRPQQHSSSSSTARPVKRTAGPSLCFTGPPRWLWQQPFALPARRLRRRCGTKAAPLPSSLESQVRRGGVGCGCHRG